MNKILKYSLMLLAVGCAFTACKDEDDQRPIIPVEGPQVFFSSELPETIELSKSTNSFSIPVTRVDSVGALTVPVTVTLPDGSIFTAPKSVTFADGQKTTNLVISYDPNAIVYGDYTDITVQIGDENVTTPYGNSAFTFSAGATAWVSMGMATFRDDLVAGTYGADPITYEVEIEKNIVEDGIYRLVYPYGAGYPYNDPGDWDTTKDYYMLIDATDPDYVWVPAFETGLNWGDGPMSIGSFVQYFLDQGNSLDAIKANVPEYFGTLENGVITFPEPKSFLAGFNGTYDTYYSNNRGMTAIALPGSRIADYTVKYEYLGRFIDTEGQYYVEGVPSLGEDIVSAKAALVTAETLEDVYAALVAGEYKDAVDVLDGETFRLPFDETGTYYVLIIGFDEEGNPVGELASKVDAVIETGEEPASSWEALYVGDYYYDLLSNPKENKFEIDEGLTLYRDAENHSLYKIEPWGNGCSLQFILNEDNSITIPAGQPTGISGAHGELFVTDIQTFSGNSEDYANYVSNYKDGVFTFYTVFYNEQDRYGVGHDTFTLTGNAEVKKAVKVAKKGMAKPFFLNKMRVLAAQDKFDGRRTF
ncbi:MAG: hypothetical protein IJ699_01460 [Bacteroidaceae bacterium]|nr:hypothetical protein [Bacteroidaceae bacterium]